MDQKRTGNHLPQRTPVRVGGQNQTDGATQNLYWKVVITHSPCIKEYDVKPILSIVEDIMSLAKPFSADNTNLGAQIPSHSGTIDDIQVQQNSDPVAEVIKELECPINYTSYVISWICDGGVDAHAATMELLKSLSTYSWEVKAAITYAAFAINYGEFCLLHQLHYLKNQLAESIGTLMGFPDVMALGNQLQMELKAVLDVLTAALKVTHCIVEFKEIPSMYISHLSPQLIPITVYWVLRSLLVCASTLMNLFGDFNEYITSTSAAAMETLLSLGNTLSAPLLQLQNELKICKYLIERQKAEDEYVEFMNRLESGRLNNMKVFRTMIRSIVEKKGEMTLYNGSKQTKEPLEVLSDKYVLVLISDLKLPGEELNILSWLYSQQPVMRLYEVLWLPIVNLTNSVTSLNDINAFLNLQNNMPWYSVDHPSLVKPLAIRYIQEVWKFVDKPILVALDPDGTIWNINALPMIWLWGGDAFPFTYNREELLWGKVTWNIDLLASAVDLRIPEWIGDNKVICLYGGDDMAWIRKFIRSSRAVADELHIPLEMLYVGKSNPKDEKVKVRRCQEVINRNELSHTLSDDQVWFFWARISSMFNSRAQLRKTPENDDILREISDVLNLDKTEQGWAVFGWGNNEMAKANGDRALSVLERYRHWSNDVDHPDKFVTMLDEEFSSFRGHAVYVPENLVCNHCGKTMDKYIMYRCSNK